MFFAHQTDNLVLTAFTRDYVAGSAPCSDPDENDEKEVHMSNTPANPNQAPAPAAPPTKAPKSIAAIVGLILGIIALVLSAMPIINNFAFILGIIGLIFGIVGVVGTRDKKKSGKGIAIASVIVAALACVIVLASQAVYSAALDEAGQPAMPPKRFSAAKST